METGSASRYEFRNDKGRSRTPRSEGQRKSETRRISDLFRFVFFRRKKRKCSFAIAQIARRLRGFLLRTPEADRIINWDTVLF